MTMRYEPELVSEGCEPARIGRALAMTLAREHELDLAPCSSPTAELYHDDQKLHAYDRTQMLRAALACHRAKSLDGCRYQLAEAVCRLDAMHSGGRVPDSFAAGEDYRAALRCLYSVAGFLDGLAGTDDLPGRDCLMPDGHNPWIRVEDRVAAVETRHGEARS
ncbi:hypothetical protein CDV49_19000 [Haematobacter genomosp. 1]|uniref:Uncharacterized protein n=2 Tax=Haematobacter genomosp. 1 TaxID=366618 RepID=A0A212A6L6_9RHOB|nr:hypothetical protein CDV49_19000 [Haematobacter genomosp. 1]